MNPIKIKLITKGKNTHTHTNRGGKISSTGVERDSRTESKGTDGKKKDERDLRELRVGTVAARLHCSFVSPHLSGKGCQC